MALACFGQVAGGQDESVMQPRWGPGGELVFISDRSGFWNLYRHDGGGGGATAAVQQGTPSSAAPPGPSACAPTRSLPDGR